MESASEFGKPGQNLDLVFLKPTTATKPTTTTTKAAAAAKAVAEEEEDVFAPPPPPDGGYGWWVVLGAFFVNLLCDGTAFSFAIYFNDLGAFFGKIVVLCVCVGG